MTTGDRIAAPQPLVTDPVAAHSEGQRFLTAMSARRSIRDFSDAAVPRQMIELAIRAAGTAPSGANQQPWHFAAVSNAGVKRRIRLAAEAEEREFYQRRASADWLSALEPIGTNADKPFLETAAWLIGVFVQKSGTDAQGNSVKHYYPTESTGLATGLLISALHQMGLATLTHTPSPMRFLNEILGRPSSERPFVLLVVGYAANDATVPDLTRKSVDDISSYFD